MDATRADFDLASTRPLPPAGAARSYLPGHSPSELSRRSPSEPSLSRRSPSDPSLSRRSPSEPSLSRPTSEPASSSPPGHGRGGSLAGRMTLTPLVPLLPSVAALAGTGSERPGVLPPPRPPALSAAAVLMSGAAPGSSPPASHAPLPPVAPRGAPSSPPAVSARVSSPPVMTTAPVVTRAAAGMDFDDATLVRMDDEPPILLQRRKSVPPATPAAPAAPAEVDESGERLSSASEPEKRGLLGRLLSRVLG
ncbi:MAG: hypothetical protein EOO75_06590 [Myxococcales bacterium]|nr:MAG: hypothetical protein EOO75_06590 [Myxococcales bacterium]